jgi:hypothetical protein
MEGWQERLLLEHAQLAERYKKLQDFLLTQDKYHTLEDQGDIDLLWRQLGAMCAYKDVLVCRIRKFIPKGAIGPHK